MTAEQKIKDLFETFDEDLNGFIDLNEFSSAMKVLYPQFEQYDIEYMFKYSDRDKNGYLDFNEFKNWLLSLEKQTEEQNIYVKLFKYYDLNGDGKIQFDELVYTYKIIDENVDIEMLKNTFELFDTDHDGILSFDEYVKYNKHLTGEE